MNDIASWTPVWAMPNVTLAAPVEASHAALVPSNDDRLVALARRKPALETFLSAFHNEFGNQVAPTIGLVPEDALKSVLTVTAFGGFRDAVCMSAVIASQTRTTTLTFRWRTAEDHERDAEAAEAERLLDEGKTIECERAEAERLRDEGKQVVCIGWGDDVRTIEHEAGAETSNKD
jgi:hypothetical protein